MFGEKNFNLYALMKNLFKLSVLALSSVFALSCNKELTSQDAPVSEATETVQFSTAPITKTVFGTPDGTTVPTLWTTNNTVAVTLNFAAFKKSSELSISEDSKTAAFSADLKNESSVSKFAFRAVSPFSCLTSTSINSPYNSIGITIPSDQTPLDGSVDEDAQILFAKRTIFSSSIPSEVSLDFNHITAYGKLSFSNLALSAGETISKVELISPENWSGRYSLYLDTDGDHSEGDIEAHTASKTISLNTNKSSDIWFACAPVDLSGKKVKVVVTTNVGNYTKEVTIPSERPFTAGHISSFTINMSGITAVSAETYTLVKDIKELTIESEIIIAAADYDQAISTTQNTNNRAPAGITKSDDKQSISSPGESVQILTLRTGAKDETYSFYTGSGYLHAASSSSNHLKTQTTVDPNASWSITIASSGVATIRAQGSNKRNLLRYNSDSKLFSCYKSGQKDVCIYKKN